VLFILDGFVDRVPKIDTELDKLTFPLVRCVLNITNFSVGAI